jgi:hypothetical protein
MTQAELDRRIAHATGESLRTINRMGFVPLRPTVYERDREPLVVDWDDVESRRNRRNTSAATTLRIR